jgi:5-methylcytosine-specific restriction endonuclease McrA
MKICSLCKVQKLFTDFSPDKRDSSGVQSRCKVCFAQIMRERRAKNPEAHRQAVGKSTKKNYKAKLERNNLYRTNNPEKVHQWKKKDRTENKARILADCAKRRTLLAGETSVEIRQLYVLKDFYQAMSLGERFHVDHIVPLSRGGLHAYKNMRVIPAIDNLRKGNK